MAAGRLPEVGTEYGPCEGECKHLDCAETRRMAASVCRYCDGQIGYETRYYSEAESPKSYVHARCAEDDAEKVFRQRRAQA